MHKSILSLFLILVFLPTILLLSSLARADTARGIKTKHSRYALVIGNGNYPASPLKNPVNDSEDIAQVLGQLGFMVMHRQDVGIREMEKAVREFGKLLKIGGTGVFYYAGHGMQVEGHNYLIPVDAKIESESDVRFEALDVGRVLGKMEDAGNGLNIVILDACRDNPFARGFRSARNGLARMDAPRGTLIAYATSPGSVAADGTGRNGIYTKNLLKHISTPGLLAEQVFKYVRIGVIRDTGEKQIPWESSSLTGNFYFAQVISYSPTEINKKSPPPSSSGVSQEILNWESVKDSNNPDMLQAYLKKYPDGEFSGIAQTQLKNLQQSETINTPPVVQENVDEEKNNKMLTYEQGERKATIVRLRTESKKLSNQSHINNMVINYGFYEKERNPQATFRNEFIEQNDEIVIDQQTGLMWQRAGSDRDKSFIGAKDYIAELNEAKYCGYADWRLPTIEELASLIMEVPSEELYVASVFDHQKKKCWSGDITDPTLSFFVEISHAVWIVDFSQGRIVKAIWYDQVKELNKMYGKNRRNYVRAVRSFE